MSNTSSYSEIPQIWRKTRSYCSLLKQMESHSIRRPLCLSSCLWVCTWFEKENHKAQKRAAFPLNQRNEIINPKMTRMLCGSHANYLHWVIYLIFFFPFLKSVSSLMGLLPQLHCLSQKNILGRIESNRFTLLFSCEISNCMHPIFINVFLHPLTETLSLKYFYFLQSRLMSNAYHQ